MVLDLGVSSMQLDQAERGFSFRFDGPLDMRMAARAERGGRCRKTPPSAISPTSSILLGEERHSRGVARAIVRARVRSADSHDRTPWPIWLDVWCVRKPGDIHPATRTFQALRLFVNDELGELATALAAAERVLKPDGRLVVVSFHSLEDRIVQNFFAARSGTRAGSCHRPEIAAAPATFTILTKRPVVADHEEVSANPRARSAKLRAAERTSAPVDDIDLPLLPDLPSLDVVLRGGRA